MTPTQLRTQVLDCITDHLGITADEIAVKLGADREDVRIRLFGLSREGLIAQGEMRMCSISRLWSHTYYEAALLREAMGEAA